MGLFYVAAGANHFINPDFYLDLIPPYFPNHELLNQLAGFVEIGLGIGIFFEKTRSFAAYGVIILLISLIPAHVYMIQMDGQMGEFLNVSPWIAWFRLFPMQFVLMYWAWIHQE